MYRPCIFKMRKFSPTCIFFVQISLDPWLLISELDFGLGLYLSLLFLYLVSERNGEKWEDCGIVEFCEWLEFRLALIRFVYFNLDLCKWNVIIEVLDLVRFDLELWAMIGFIWICIDSDDSFCWCYIFYTSFANVCEICVLGFCFLIF